jgi:phage repressor protein C with HTH and peptisase S24 domain
MRSIDDIRRSNMEILELDAGGLSALAVKLERSESQVGQWKKGYANSGTGKPRGMSSSSARHIEKMTGKPEGWVDQDHQSNVEAAPDLIASRRIPVSGTVKGGPDGFLEGSQYPPDHGEGYIETWARDRMAYALRVIGDSMAPRYRAGEFIVVTPSIEAMPGMDVVVCLKDGRKLLKNLGWKRVNTVQLLSVNDNYPPITVGLDEIESISRVASSAPPDAFIDG